MNNDISRLRRPASNRKRRNQPRAPSPSVAEPRRPLLLAVLAFMLAARACPGVQRISLLGSILTAKVIPKDVDVLVTIDAAMDLTRLARSGRRLMGQAQTINLGADIFLADTTGRYLGRICRYRECQPRVLCHAQHCGQRDHLNDDLHIVTLSQELISSPPVDLWPNDIRRVPVPADVADLLLTKPRTRSVADRARSLLCDPRKCPALGKDRTRREMPTKSRFDPKATSATHRNRKLGGQPWTALAKVAF